VNITPVGVGLFVIGRDLLDLETLGMSDREVLEATEKLYPHGFNVMGGNIGPVWMHAGMLLGLAQPDGFGLELMGLGATAADIIRLCTNPTKADTLGGKGVERLMVRFCKQSEDRATAKRVNQIHAYRFGITCKIVAADRVHPHTIEVHPKGNVNRAIARMFGCKPHETRGRWMVGLRSPFLYPIVVQVEFNDKLTKNLGLMNRLDARRTTKCDFDGDGFAWFPTANEEQALELWEQLEIAVPSGDPTLLIRGITAHGPEAEMWGEVVTKTTDQKLDQCFTKTMDAWVQAHSDMGKCANVYTPYAYRISDVCSAMAAMGIEGARTAGMLGAVVEEDYYLGLAGGPKGLNEALETWMSKKMSKANQCEMFAGLAKGVDPNILTQDVKNALVRGALINKGKMDEFLCTEAIPYFGWMIGKGFTSTGGHGTAAKLPILDRLKALCAIAEDPNVPEYIRDNFITKMAFYAARKLSQVVGDTPAMPGSDESSDDEHQWSESDITEH
jgi:hypothetical protein